MEALESFDNEIDFADSEGFDGMKSTTSCLRLARLRLLSLFIQHATSTSTILGRVNHAMSNDFAEHFGKCRVLLSTARFWLCHWPSSLLDIASLFEPGVYAA